MNQAGRRPFRFARIAMLLAFQSGIWMVAGAASAHEVHLEGRTFTLPNGMTIERVAAPPIIDRPIQADFDELGNLYVADSSGSSENVQQQLKDKPHRIVRLSAADEHGIFHSGSTFADHLMFPEGAMWKSGALYVGAPPSIWKLFDSNHQGISDRREEWFAGKTLTGCANDLHGPYAGLDGWIYWCKGAFAEQTYLLRGNKPFITRAAHIFRARPDGSGIEPVMTGGMDNPVHVAFMPNGERFFTATFLQNPAGGRRDGIIHAIYGGIYGKVHDVIENHSHTSPEIMPVLVHLGPAAACGLAVYDSNVLGEEYRGNLFASSFNLHKITRHVLTPTGATYSSKDLDFLLCDSLDFHPTDIIEDADGSLLIVDTGGWYKLCCPTSQLGKPDVFGAIYRVRRENAPHVDDPRGLKLAWGSMKPTELAGLLGNTRHFVRKRAIDGLSARGVDALPAVERVLRFSASREARLNAVWAATRIDAPEARRVVRIALHDGDESVRQAAAHSASVWRDADSLNDLAELLDNQSAFNRRVAAEALGRLGDPQAIPALFKQIALDNDHVLDHSMTYALIEIDNPPATAAGLTSTSFRVQRSAMIALDQMEGGKVNSAMVAKAMTSADQPLRETAAWIASRHSEWGDQLADVMRQRIADAKANNREMQELAAQLANLSASRAIELLLVQTLNNPIAPPRQKQLALDALARVTAREVPTAYAEAVAGVIQHASDETLKSAIRAAGSIHWNKRQRQLLAGGLLDSARRSDLPDRIRLEALNAVQGAAPTIGPELFSFLLAQLHPEQAADQQLLAATALSRARLLKEQLLELTTAMSSVGPLEIGPLLDAFQQTADPAVGRRLLDALKKARSLTSIRVEVLRARLAAFGDQVIEESQPLLTRLDPDSAAQKKRLDQIEASLPVGDVRRGQLIFNSTKAACVSCHAIGYVGGQVGPDLTRVGATRTRRDLLESIVYPSASFVQSYQPVAVQTRNGPPQYGILKRDDAEGLVLVTGPNQEMHIARAEIKAMRPGKVSLMPAGFGEQLTPPELADLLAFLKACE